MEYEQPSIIIKVGALLREPIDLDNLVEPLLELERLRYEVVEQKAEWLALLYQKRSQMLWPKTKEKTELDRKTVMDASVAVIEKDYQLLCDVDSLIRERLTVVRLLLEYTPRK
jgi:hypothetical protein